MDTDINIKGLVKLGKALSGLADAVEVIDTLEAKKKALEGEVAARQKAVTELGADLVKAKDLVADAKDAAKDTAAKAKRRAEEVGIKADLDAQELLKKAQTVLDGATAMVKDAEIRKSEVELEIAAKSEAVATLAKQEAEILARIADAKAKLIAALG